MGSLLAQLSGNPGNSCIHLTDEQTWSVLHGPRKRLAKGHGCDSSYAFSCARTLLHPASLEWLNGEIVSSLELGSVQFRSAWDKYCDWLLLDKPGVTQDADGNYIWTQL